MVLPSGLSGEGKKKLVRFEVGSGRPVPELGEQVVVRAGWSGGRGENGVTSCVHRAGLVSTFGGAVESVGGVGCWRPAKPLHA